MLPFLKKDYQAQGISMKMRKPDETSEAKPEENHALNSCAMDLINAVHAKDMRAAAAAMKAAFEILESMPHEEAEHISGE